jgi:hypothetical protein
MMEYRQHSEFAQPAIDIYYALRRLRRIVGKQFFGTSGTAGRFLRIRRDDIFLVSYPRSGNTWLRFLLGELIHGVEIDFDNMELYIPDIYRNTHATLEAMDGPRYLKSHEPFDKRYPKVIYLVRDPRAVCISYYKWMRKFRKFNGTFEEFFKRYLLKSDLPYGRWDDHVLRWIHSKRNEEIKIVRFEELRNMPDEVLSDILDFMGINRTSDMIRQAVEKNSIECMRKKEKRISPKNAFFNNTDKNMSFVGKGQCTSWDGRLTEEQVRTIDSAFWPAMKLMGYSGEKMA